LQKDPESFKKIDPEFSKLLLTRAISALILVWRTRAYARLHPETAPYFYEEENWVDDMELAAIELYNETKDLKYFNFALEFGRKEPVTPWMGSDTARHYQWYPFVNMGHPAIARHQKIKSGP